MLVPCPESNEASSRFFPGTLSKAMDKSESDLQSLLRRNEIEAEDFINLSPVAQPRIKWEKRNDDNFYNNLYMRKKGEQIFYFCVERLDTQTKYLLIFSID